MPLQAGATQDEDEGANAADCELAAALSWWSLYDAMRLYIFCARPHLPSGRYRRIVKGIFFSFSSFIAIWGGKERWVYVHKCSACPCWLGVVQARGVAAAAELAGADHGSDKGVLPLLTSDWQWCYGIL